MNKSSRKLSRRKDLIMKRRANGEGNWFYDESRNSYRYNCAVGNGKRKSFYGKTKKQCMDKYKAYISVLSDRGEIVSSRTTVEEYYRRYLSVSKGLIADTTHSLCISYLNMLKRSGYDLLNRQLGNVTAENITEFFRSFSPALSHNTALRAKSILSQVFDLAVKEGRLRNNPVREAVLAKRTLPARPKQFFIEEEASRFSRYIEENPSDIRYMLLFILHTGLRAGELLGLKWENVRSNQIFITDNLVRLRTYDEDLRLISDSDLVKAPKTNSGLRSIPLDKTALKVLSFFEAIPHTPSSFVFVRKNGSSPCKESLRYQLQRVCLLCGLPQLTTHELRHTFGSLLLSKGTDIKVISELLGHSSVTVTYGVYIHVSDAQFRNAVNTLDTL